MTVAKLSKCSKSPTTQTSKNRAKASWLTILASKASMRRGGNRRNTRYTATLPMRNGAFQPATHRLRAATRDYGPRDYGPRDYCGRPCAGGKPAAHPPTNHTNKHQSCLAPGGNRRNTRYTATLPMRNGAFRPATHRLHAATLVAIAARLRKETILPIKSIAARVGLGTSKGANRNLHVWMQQTEKQELQRKAGDVG